MDAAFQSGLASASLEVVFDRFVTFALREIGSILDADDGLRKLEFTLLKTQALLDDAESSEQMTNKAQQVWFQDLKNASYDAEDLLDEVALGSLKLHLNSNKVAHNDNNKVRSMVFSSFRLDIPHEISSMRRRLEDIASEVDSIFVTQRVKSWQPKTRVIPRGTSSLIDESFVVGREEEKHEIIQMLLSSQELENVSVIPIVGMGGLGKTTLARIVYNDEEVVESFDLRIWVSVTAEFDAIRITKSIIESLTGINLNLSDLDPIQVRLQELIKEKKFLLVLDDMWNENYSDWEVLKAPFRVGLGESKILITTRSTIVSSIVATTPDYYLQILSDEDCWALIKQRAFSNGNLDDEHENLVKIGKEIAKKCKGLPLAAKTLGSVLSSKSDEMEWDDVLKSKLWDLPEDKNEILPALRLSYNHLPANLKICFSYCSIFPHNYEFEKDSLVQLWMAEGFIQPRGTRRMEDIGKYYFDDLLSRSFFQFSHENVNKQLIYIMHDLIHYLAQVVSAGICFRVEDDMSCLYPIFRNARHSSLILENIQPMTSKALHKYKSLRTLMLLHKNGSCIEQIPYDLFSKLRRLRVLDFSCTGIKELPDSIGNLKHLRYLNISKTHIHKLPESITSIYGLQTLELKDCRSLREFPKDMKNLTKLRHLDFDIDCQLESMPLEFGKLTSLQTLRALIVGKGCHIGELKNMRDLRGSICIKKLENVRNEKEAKEAMLGNKPYLDKLELRWKNANLGDRLISEEVLAGLKPHDRLKELRVTSYSGFLFPNWLADPSMCKLVSIELLNCRYCKHLPPLGQLPFLKSLNIEEMHDLKQVYRDFCGWSMGEGFPSLENLTFYDMRLLEEWDGLFAGDMPRLHQLKLLDCPNLVSLPSLDYLNSLEELEISRCPKLQQLPEEGLPISLKSLIITESDILKERCKEGEGEDWLKIRTIPKIEIDYVEIPMQG